MERVEGGRAWGGQKTTGERYVQREWQQSNDKESELTTKIQWWG